MDGVNFSIEVVYKKGQDYRFVCYDWGRVCWSYCVWFFCGKFVRFKFIVIIDINVNSIILNLEDNVQLWKFGDILVIVSIDYFMYQVEEFQVFFCRFCVFNQVKVVGKLMYLYIGEEIDGVDMWVEVGFLSWNIIVMGEMEDKCYFYRNYICNFFDFDIFGGYIKFVLGFKVVYLEGMELKYMGQQLMGQYLIYFYLVGDVDERGGYNLFIYIRDFFIYYIFFCCVIVYGFNGLLIKDVVGYNFLGYCFFMEDGLEECNIFDYCFGFFVKFGIFFFLDCDSKMCKMIIEDFYFGYIFKFR